MSHSAPLIVSTGDPAGVGPELIAETWRRRTGERLAPFAVMGGAKLLKAAGRERGIQIAVRQVSELNEAVAVFPDALPVLGDADCSYRPGEPEREGASFALAALDDAARLALSGQASALVTGPIAKARLAEVGFRQPGQTEFVAEVCGVEADDAVMMLAGPSLRTIPLTVHVPLAEVPRLVTRDLIERRARIAAAALSRDFGILHPRIAICGLNPHAGEEGRMGNEDLETIAPAIAALRAEGLDVNGPHPADALFSAHGRSAFDVALCMYHDQALIPVKTLDFDEGVNVTLGLPIIRTSPDHGTAFALAGKREAHAGAMIAAIRMAGECAERRAAA